MLFEKNWESLCSRVGHTYITDKKNIWFISSTYLFVCKYALELAATRQDYSPIRWYRILHWVAEPNKFLCRVCGGGFLVHPLNAKIQTLHKNSDTNRWILWSTTISSAIIPEGIYWPLSWIPSNDSLSLNHLGASALWRRIFHLNLNKQEYKIYIKKRRNHWNILE